MPTALCITAQRLLAGTHLGMQQHGIGCLQQVLRFCKVMSPDKDRGQRSCVPHPLIM
jgi:hypothetical protein